MAMPLPMVTLEPDPYRLAPTADKRCTFRRLIQVTAGAERLYDVECLLPDRRLPIPLGNLDAGNPVLQRLRGAAHVRAARRGLIAETSGGWLGGLSRRPR